MAWIQKARKRWRVCWRTGGRGSPVKKSETYAHKYEAEEAAKSIDAHLDAQRPITPGAPLTLTKVAARYVKSREGRTTKAYRDDVVDTIARLAVAHGWDSCMDVTAEQAASLKVKQSRLVKSVLRYASTILGQRIDQTALSSIRTRSPRHRPLSLIDEAEVARVYDQAHKWAPGNGAIVHMISTYGHRAQSLVGLPCSAYQDGTITMPIKSGDTHRHPLTVQTRAILDALTKDRAPSAPLFPSHLEDGKAWPSGQMFAGWLCHSCKGSVLALRRYGITHMLDLKLDGKTVASITGHRTVSLLLDVYARTNEARQANAVELIGGASTVLPHKAKRKK